MKLAAPPQVAVDNARSHKLAGKARTDTISTDEQPAPQVPMRRSIIHAIRHTPVMIASACIRAYQVMVRPFLIGACKFHPTCSEYALEALERHGFVRGGWLAFRRVIRCVPGTMGGYDPVPDGRRDRSTSTKPTSSGTDRAGSREAGNDP